MTEMQVSVIVFGLLGLFFLGQSTVGGLIRLFSKRLTLGFVIANAMACGLFLLLSFAASIWEIQGLKWSDVVSQLLS
ncbi:hypothetical protein GZ77_02675 [Endozoicomonas montiporae]|uniref:Uncharacterized protein n=2 Tax=Endozoicomonas montiporae TaxID=1027273 RepID=A0A081NAS0_9GAMM|nr:hypothetical protein [Endozoicomonas montiporae]AMO56764.1 hypothetical protein EZMO1_2707 [Endozoicomonas montiporae CL-33]KEQ15543.1 hypothetical protein GZ77_02675 [Endozoicomonas montiporae]